MNAVNNQRRKVRLMYQLVDTIEDRETTVAMVAPQGNSHSRSRELDSDALKYRRVESLSEFEQIGEYLKTARKYPLLSKDAEFRLATQMRQGDDKAREVFINSNLRLVVSVAKRYRNRGLSLEELIQEGNVGLIKAIDKFDPDKGCRFSTYGVWWIRQSIIRAICEKASSIRLPDPFYEKIQAVQSVIDEVNMTEGRDPCFEEIVSRTGLSKKKVIEAMSWSRRPISVDQEYEDIDGSFSPKELPDLNSPLPDEEADWNMELDRLILLVAKLPTREREVLSLRYGLSGEEPESVEATARKLRLSPARVEYFEKRGITKLKRLVRSNAVDPIGID